MSTALITGGSGFIGSGIVMDLVRRGWSVFALDVNSPDSYVNEESTAGVIRHVQGDVRDQGLVDRLVAEADLVFHMAAIVGVDEYIQRALDVLDVNLMGTRNVLDACRRHGRPVVFASSSEVYGLNTARLQEDARKVYGSLTNVRWVYALSKATGEEYAQAMVASGLRFISVRYFNVYGPTMDTPGQGRVIAKFLGCLRDGRPLPVVGGGSAVRSFCYLDDAVEATVRLGISMVREASFVNEPVNIGRYEPVSIRDLAHLMIRLSGREPGLQEVDGMDFFGPGFEEIPLRLPNLSRLREVTGFEAQIDLEEGLRRTLTFWGLLNETAATEADNAPPVPVLKVQIEPDQELLDSISAILWSGRLSNDGPTVRELERSAAEFLDAAEVVAVTNGALALEMALAASAPGAGAVVLPAYTFIATLNAVVQCGLEPVFCDIDPATFTLDPPSLTAILSSRSDVRAVVPVNVFGVPPDLVAIRAIADRAGARLVLDNAHGFGTEVNGSRLLAEPLVQIFSLHATKVVPAGEGGLVVTADQRIAAEIRRLRNHGLASDPRESALGTNAKMTEIAAVIALHSLREVPAQLSRRHKYAERLRAALAETGDVFTPQQIPEGVQTCSDSFGVRCRTGAGGIEAVICAFRDHGVETRRYFWPPLHSLPAWNGMFHLPVTDAVVDSLICLPLHGRMKEATLRRVETAIRAVGAMLKD